MSPAAASPAGAFSSVLNAAVSGAASTMEQQVGRWTDKLNGIADGGAKQTAGAAGIEAAMHGKSPVWAAVKGAWRGGTPAVRAAIVAAIVALSHALQVKVIGEGVESEQQRDFLRRCGCDYLQGYLIGRPLDSDNAAKDYV
jgi:hypothetical protein